MQQTTDWVGVRNGHKGTNWGKHEEGLGDSGLLQTDLEKNKKHRAVGPRKKGTSVGGLVGGGVFKGGGYKRTSRTKNQKAVYQGRTGRKMRESTILAIEDRRGRREKEH